MHHTDLSGIFHGRVFELFEDARTEVFRRLGFEYRTVIEAGQAMVALDVGATFSRPLRVIDDEIEIGVFVSLLTRVRITVEYELRRLGEDAAAVTGHTTFAFVDPGRSRPVAVPAGIHAAVAACPGMLRRRA